MSKETINDMQTIIDHLTKTLAKKVHLSSSKIDINKPLSDYGLDSVDAVSFTADLGTHYGVDLEPTVIWDYQTIIKMSEYILDLCQCKENNKGLTGLHLKKENNIENKKEIFPSIDQHRRIDNDRHIFAKLLSLNDFYIRDHIIKKNAIFPGSAYIEMAYQAGKIINQNKITTLNNIMWLQPIILNENEKRIKLALKPDSGQFKIETEDSQGKTTTHGKGKISDESIENMPCLPSLADIEQRCTKLIKQDSFYNNYKKIGFNYGDSFRSVEWIKYSENEALAKLVLDKELANTSHHYTLHPSIIDGAFQSVICLLQDHDKSEKVTFLPYTIKKLIIWSPTQPHCFVYVKKVQDEAESHIKRFDLTIFDSNHSVLVELKGFGIKSSHE